eukprot:3317278-Rhodomonas_salina.3
MVLAWRVVLTDLAYGAHLAYGTDPADSTGIAFGTRLAYGTEIAYGVGTGPSCPCIVPMLLMYRAYAPTVSCLCSY